MLTHAPLPSWAAIGRALLSRSPPSTLPTAPWSREGDTGGWLARTAWSMALVALWRQHHSGKQTISVWIPAYFCNESLNALRRSGVRLVFYPVTDDLTPDLRACKELAISGSPDVFLCVHYFGRPIPASAVRDFCANHKAWFIEDAAHVLRPQSGIGTSGDFVLYSPHKHLPIPDGAVLVVRPNGPGKFGSDGIRRLGPPDGWPAQLDALRRDLKVGSGTGGATIWLCKRVLQKMGFGRRRTGQGSFAETTSTPPQPSSTLLAPEASWVTRAMLPSLVTELADVGQRRRCHMLLWDSLVGACPPGSIEGYEPSWRPSTLDWEPYMVAYGVASGTGEWLYNRWRGLGLPVSTWPDLAPEVTAEPGRYGNAWSLRHEHVHLATHQGLSAREMVARTRQERPEPRATQALELVWDRLTRLEWDRLLEKTGRSNALQSWGYGDAKHTTEGWQVRRGVFLEAGEPRAIVQVLQKRVAGILLVSRLNRGPLFLQVPTFQDQETVWRQLSLLGDWRRARALFVAPEMDLSGASLLLLAELGFRTRPGRSWSSARIDLSMDLTAIRKGLNGKWRNMLASSEKAGLALTVDPSPEAFEWIVREYEQLMRDREFVGPPPKLLREWRAGVTDDEPMVVLRAVEGGETVAGVCLALHGSSATYLLGWNGDRGRRSRASHYLLWHSIEYLKQAGLRWFDLGGIDEVANPGIAQFKLGMGGEFYDSVGEYWKT